MKFSFLVMDFFSVLRTFLLYHAFNGQQNGDQNQESRFDLQL